MKQHSHAVNAAVTGLSELPSMASSFAATRAMTRFLTHEGIGFSTLLEPAQDAVRVALAASPSPFALVVHDWCMFGFNTHSSKPDRDQRSHDDDLGYELGTALVVDAADGRPLGPMELRLRTAPGMLSTRPGNTARPPGHVDELSDAMAFLPTTNLNRTLVHVVDREADSVAHYRAWSAAGHRFLVRTEANRLVQWYAWRWRIETFHKLLKSAGVNAEEWPQESGAAFLRRLCVAVMACLTVWHLQRDTGEEAARLRTVLVRLSGRVMKHRVESTAPALLAGLEKLLALDDLIQHEDVAEILTLARRVLPQLFRSG